MSSDKWKIALQAYYRGMKCDEIELYSIFAQERLCKIGTGM